VQAGVVRDQQQLLKMSNNYKEKHIDSCTVTLKVSGVCVSGDRGGVRSE